MSTADTKNTAQPVTLTEAARNQIKQLLADEDDPNVFLRLGVSPGGCSGMSYSMDFDTEVSDFDRVLEFDDGIQIRVDLKALVYLQGVTIDYKNAMVGGGFLFDNPNARRSCGCGTSFSC